MNVLVVGSGGREHVIGWKLSQSPRNPRLIFAPGNAGTASLGHNIDIAADDIPAIVAYAGENDVGLVLVGPEVPLAAGLADALRAAGVPVFGPSRAAAQIESSKSFAKAFMDRHSIPSGRFAVFSEYEPALAYLRQVDFPVVIKASGLAAGKGVIVPETTQDAKDALHAMLVESAFADAGSKVVIEERLSGPEVSLLAFTDGRTVRPMPPSQDHKRLLEGDQGPNTGGMGAYAPAPICPSDLVEHAVETVLQPAVDGLLQEGMPFVGVLYAGLMLTPSGMQVLEFNCRFGDPETQVILPLLETDLLDVVLACVEGRLDALKITWKSQAAACVVLASENYPGKVPSGRVIHGLDGDTFGSMVFHAGTRRKNGETVTSGGRVLCVTGWGENIPEALEVAYGRVGRISFEGMQYRRDIGYQALEG
jgi:phosphoribosylamine--glycine ligase